MLEVKSTYEREDLMKEADVIALDCIRDYDLSDYAATIQRSAHWAVNAVCNRLWVKNGSKEPVIDKDLATLILNETKNTIIDRCNEIEKELTTSEMER